MEVKKVECTGMCYFVLLLALFQFMECGILLIVMLKCKVQVFCVCIIRFNISYALFNSNIFLIVLEK